MEKLKLSPPQPKREHIHQKKKDIFTKKKKSAKGRVSFYGNHVKSSSKELVLNTI